MQLCWAPGHSISKLMHPRLPAGTFPLQSERMFAALQGHGCKCRLVVLPHESHGYRAHESVMHVLAEKEKWLEAYCKNAQFPGESTGSNGVNESKQKQQLQQQVA